MAVNISVDNFIDKVFGSFRKVTPALLAREITTAFILFANEAVGEVY